jgi:hypothetical protein
MVVNLKFYHQRRVILEIEGGSTELGLQEDIFTLYSVLFAEDAQRLSD